MNTRIKQVRKYANLNQNEFAERLGLSASAITMYERGLRNPTSAILKAMAKEFHISEEWLMSGEGEMLSPQTKEEEIADITAKLFQESDDSFRYKLIKLLAQMDDKQMQMLKDFAEKLAKE